MAELLRNAPPKPVKGTALIERRQHRLDRVAAEQKVMQAALKRDDHKCRNPKCGFKKALKLPIDPAHVFQHRGMGGNPAGDRTAERKQIMALCRGCHGLVDAGELSIEPLTPDWCDGVCAFFEERRGRMEHIASERVIGVSVAVGN